MRFSFLILAALMLLSSGCGGVAQYVERRNERPTVRAQRVQAGRLPEILAFTGVLHARHKASVSSANPGVVDRVAVEDGDYVSAGQPVIWLQSDELRARLNEQEASVAVAQTRIHQLESQVSLSSGKVSGDVSQAESAYQQAVISTRAAETQLASAKADEQRMAMLYKEKAIPYHQLEQAKLTVKLQQDQLATARSKQAAAREAIGQARKGSYQTRSTEAELEGARASLIQSEASVATLRVQLDQTVLRSPISGVIVDRNVEPGQSVGGGGTPLLSVVDNHDLYCVVNVDQRYAAVLHDGMMASIEFPTRPGVTTRGYVRDIIPSSDPKTRTVRVKIMVSNETRTLMDGLSLNGRLTLSESKGVLIPRDALRARDGRSFVWAVENSRIKEKPISYVAKDQLYVLATKGIKAGDIIVVEASEVQPGELVDVQMTK
jgi:multidrug efflux pump subunit AcrA (membrane-fusion protein)